MSVYRVRIRDLRKRERDVFVSAESCEEARQEAEDETNHLDPRRIAPYEEVFCETFETDIAADFAILEAYEIGGGTDAPDNE